MSCIGVHHVRYVAKSSGWYLPMWPNSWRELYVVGTRFKIMLLTNSPSISFACLDAIRWGWSGLVRVEGSVGR